MVVVQSPYTSLDNAILFMNIGALGWIGMGYWFLCFALILSGYSFVLKKPWYHVIVAGMGILLLICQWQGKIITGFTRQPYGWAYAWSESIWTYIYWIYLFSTVGTAVFLFYKIDRTKQHHSKRIQAMILFYCTIISVTFASVTNVTLPYLKIFSIPALGNMFCLLWAAGLTYAITKYKLMSISPTTAADNIISTMNNLLFLLSPQGKIIMVNDATANQLGFRKEAMKNMDISDLVTPDGQKQGPVAQMLISQTVNNRKLDIKTSDGDTIPVILSTSQLQDQSGSTVGIVAIASDISELVASEKNRERIIKELETALDKIRTLSGLLPICSHCKKIRDDKEWTSVENYVSSHSEAEFSHSICPECAKKYYPDDNLYDD
jgi:PAS domain S-box-containing protein